MGERPLILIAHGTASEAGAQVVFDLAAAAGERIGREVPVGFVDVRSPTAVDVLTGTSGAVVVPYFIGAGHHVQVDVPAAAALGAEASITPHLGTDPAVVTVAAQRLTEAGFAADQANRQWRLVVVAAGSRRPEVRAEVAQIAADLGDRLGLAAQVAFAAAEPGVAEVVAAAKSAGAQVAVANLLLAPGFFNDLLHRRAGAAGADLIAAPLGVHSELVDAVVQRYQQTVGAPGR